MTFNAHPYVPFSCLLFKNVHSNKTVMQRHHAFYFFVSAVPGPPYLSVAQDSETSAVARWDPPDLTNGMDLQGYRLQFGRKDVSPLATLEFAPQERQYSVGNIHWGAIYLFKISAKSRGGFGEEAVVEVNVPENTPGGYPQINEGSNVTCCSVQLSWSPPVLAERNGVITEYTLAYKEAGTREAPRELHLPPSLFSYVLNSLKPNSAYDVKIRAHTSVGPGPYSPPIQYRTVAFDPAGRACLFVYVIQPSWRGVGNWLKLICSNTKTAHPLLQPPPPLLKKEETLIFKLLAVGYLLQ